METREKRKHSSRYSPLILVESTSNPPCISPLPKARGTLVRRMIFIAHTNGCVCQLFVVTFTSNDLMEESRALGDAAYNANWQILPHEGNKGIRNAILMMMIRSRRACCISAGGFFPVSLETFMAVGTRASVRRAERRVLGTPNGTQSAR